MASGPLHDGHSMFDRPLHAASERMAALRAEAAARPGGRSGSVARSASGLRHALGVRLLRLGAALLADDPVVVRRPATR